MKNSLRRYRQIDSKILGAGNSGELQQLWNQVWESSYPPIDREFGLDHAQLLLECMQIRQAQTILCVGNGTSLEAQAFVYAGYKVDVLDISATANRVLHEETPDREMLFRFLGRQHGKPGGRLVTHTGDFRGASPCPGPYDMIITRRMLSYLPQQELLSALKALQMRLGPAGLFYLKSRNDLKTQQLFCAHLKQLQYGVCYNFNTKNNRFEPPTPVVNVTDRQMAWFVT